MCVPDSVFATWTGITGHMGHYTASETGCGLAQRKICDFYQDDFNTKGSNFLMYSGLLKIPLKKKNKKKTTFKRMHVFQGGAYFLKYAVELIRTFLRVYITVHLRI